MSKQKILTPNFSTNGWNLKKIKAKNDKGFCGFKGCKGKLAKEPSHFVCEKICNKCANKIKKSMEEDLAKEEQRLWRNFIEVTDTK